MVKAFYAGSFDPFTYGHLNIIKQACNLFDMVIIGIGVNPDKKRRFDRNIMKSAIEQTLKSFELFNTEVKVYEGFTGEAAKKCGADILVRGLRNGSDYEYEEQVSDFNKEHYNLNTIYLRADKFGDVSSSMVMKLLSEGKDVSKYLPADVLDTINK